MYVKGPDITFTEFHIPPGSSAQNNSGTASPGAICAGPDGRIWFLHQNTGPSANGAVTVDGTFSPKYTQGVGQTNIGPIAINPGPDGNVWYTSQQKIGKMTPAGNATEFGSPKGAETGGIIKGPDGNMWFTERDVDRIGVSTTSDQLKDYPIPGTCTIAGGPTCKEPADITAGMDGNLWFTETKGNAIGRITPTGTVTEYPVPTPAAFPNAIAAGPDGNVWFVETDAHNIGRITPAGVITEFGIPSGGRPYAIAAGPDGNLWFTEPGSFNAIGRCTPTGGISEYPIPTLNTNAKGITAGPDKNMWFAEEDANSIARISNLSGGGTVSSSNMPPGSMLTLSPKCTKDTDCTVSGKACGGDVCSYKTTTPSCVLAASGDPGYCTSAADCWCASATCNATTHHCSVTTPF